MATFRNGLMLLNTHPLCVEGKSHTDCQLPPRYFGSRKCLQRLGGLRDILPADRTREYPGAGFSLWPNFIMLSTNNVITQRYFVRF